MNKEVLHNFVLKSEKNTQQKMLIFMSIIKVT